MYTEGLTVSGPKYNRYFAVWPTHPIIYDCLVWLYFNTLKAGDKLICSVN